jgi:simple sugar transport system permease protein
MITIVKREAAPSGKAGMRGPASICLALLAGAGLIALLGYNPALVYREILSGSLGGFYNFSETVQTMISLSLMALGVAVCMKINFMNIGTEGQFYMGAVFATYVGLRFPDLPAAVLLPLMLVVSLIGGGLWALLPALLKLRIGLNEVLVTLMMNYVAIKIVTYLQFGPWKDPNSRGYPTIPSFTEKAEVPDGFGVNAGWIVMLLAFALVVLILRKTNPGYMFTVMGGSGETAKYAGYSTFALVSAAVMIGGGLCGAAGFIQASAVEHSLNYQLSNGLGFTAVVVAWLGKLDPPRVALASFLIAVLLQGCAYIQISLGIPYFMVGVIQGVILFFVLGSEFFSQYRFVWRPGRPGAKREDRAGETPS